jgi:hypothetical protein
MVMIGKMALYVVGTGANRIPPLNQLPVPFILNTLNRYNNFS